MLDLHELLPDGDPLAPYEASLAQSRGAPPVRRAWAAARLVLRESYATVLHEPKASFDPAELAPHVDWDATANLRRRLDQAGFGIAEAMDTAQRFRIGWELASELMRRTGAMGLSHGFIGGAGTDHAPSARTPGDLGRAAAEQVRFIQAAGGDAILLPLIPLGRADAPPEDYVTVYDAILAATEGPLLVHWLGAAFHPDLGNYFPKDSFEQVMALDRERLVGVKLSLLDAPREVRIRRQLLEHGQVVLSGDDWNFSRLVQGTDPRVHQVRHFAGAPLPVGDFSHALLGVLDGTYRAFGLALELLARGDEDGYLELAAHAEAFGRHVFSAPTQAYKTGLAFRAWLAGEQRNFLLAGHEERLRNQTHLLEVARLAAACGAIGDPEAARERLRALWPQN
ncbi:MAG: hypothetical protein ACI8QC_000263 [Planctomycetota bacterium]|jgi:hypothetical protein